MEYKSDNIFDFKFPCVVTTGGHLDAKYHQSRHLATLSSGSQWFFCRLFSEQYLEALLDEHTVTVRFKGAFKPYFKSVTTIKF